MSGHRRPILATLVLALAVGLAACDDGAPLTEPTATAAEDIVTPAFAQGGAVRLHTTVTDQFGPAPLEATCLAVEEPVLIGGTRTIRIRAVRTPTERVHFSEHFDYSEVSVTAGDLTWVPVPGAPEHAVFQVPATQDAPGAFNIHHEFRVLYLSQDGLPDLRVTHRVKHLVGPGGEVIHDEGPVPPEPFGTAECIGSGR